MTSGELKGKEMNRSLGQGLHGEGREGSFFTLRFRRNGFPGTRHHLP